MHATLHQAVTITHGSERVTVSLDIEPDEENPSAVLSAGVYGPEGEALMTPTEAQFDDVMHTNVLGPMRVIPQIADALAPGARLVVLSSRMGSIGARTATFGWLYRASKAALNSVLKDASLAFGDRATCVAVHPGWVQTDMGGGSAPLTVETSVRGMRETLSGLTPADKGRLLHHDGRRAAHW